jgi:hypothetical protein
MSGYPCSSPGCTNFAAWVILSENAREGDPSAWGIWNFEGTMVCEGHRDTAEEEALALERHYRLVAIPAP